MIYVIIPVFNRLSRTRDCLISLRKQTFRDFRVVIVDHGSTDGTGDMIKKEFPEVQILFGDSSMWWTAATNLGVRWALSQGAKAILTLNNDLVVPEDYLSSLADSMKIHPNALIGSVSVDQENHSKVLFCGKIWNPLNAKYRPATVINTLDDLKNREDRYIKTNILPGRGTLIPSRVFETVGFYDETSFPHYMADEDLAFRSGQHDFEVLVDSKAVLFSYSNDTGFHKIQTGEGVLEMKAFLSSIKSPNNFRIRWRWAQKHTKLPFAYIILDYARVIGSQFKLK